MVKERLYVERIKKLNIIVSREPAITGVVLQYVPNYPKYAEWTPILSEDAKAIRTFPIGDKSLFFTDIN